MKSILPASFPRLLPVVTLLLLLLTTTPLLVVAVECNCNYGHQVSSASCECACDGNYQEPTCSFLITDNVSILFALNETASDFVAELFTNAVSYAASATATFVFAKNVSRFNKVVATLILPGYSVGRLLESVAYRDPWVSEYGVVSANVITPSQASSSSEFDYDHTFYQSGNITITLMGVVFLAAALVLFILMLIIGNLGSNNEDDIATMHTSHAFTKRNSSKKNNTKFTPTPTPGEEHHHPQSPKYRDRN